MPGHSFRAFLLLGLSALALSACGGRQVDPDKTLAHTPSSTRTVFVPLPSENVGAPMPLTPVADAAPVREQMAPPATLSVAEATPPAAPAPIALPPAPPTLEERVAKLEQSVGAIRGDLDRMEPAFATLTATNERVEKLLSQMGERATPAKSAAAKPAKKPAAAKAAPAVKPAAPKKTAAPAKAAEPVAAKPAAAATPSITALRIGEHESKTRLVLDLGKDAKPKFSADLDNTEHLLLIDIPGLEWKAGEGGKPSSPLIAGWSAKSTGAGGSSVAIQLKKSARVAATEFLPAAGGDPARVVIDIVPGVDG